MINITVGTNTSRKRVIVDENLPLSQVLEDNNVNMSVGTIHINGTAISRDRYDSTLAELNVPDKAFIISIAKADNAR